jgi:hypothetical protein
MIMTGVVVIPEDEPKHEYAKPEYPPPPCQQLIQNKEDSATPCGAKALCIQFHAGSEVEQLLEALQLLRLSTQIWVIQSVLAIVVPAGDV